MNVTDELLRFLRKLDGKELYNILVGPAGVHFDFSSENQQLEFSILSNTPIQIHNKLKHGVFACRPYPPYSCEEEIRSILLKKRVTTAEFDSKKNAARIVFDDEILLSLLPCIDERGEETYWSVHSHIQKDKEAGCLGFVVTSSDIRYIKHNER